MERVRESDLAAFAAADSLNARELLRFLRLRLRFILAVSAGAAALALIGSLLLPKEYTAVASVLIDPPAGGDPRAAVAINPTYIESLRAYELLASSDVLFLRAVEQFHLREGRSESLERMKRRILRVSQIRDTRVLNIAVTLPDAKMAQALAQVLAEQTVMASRAASETGDQDLLDAAQKEFEDAQARLQRER
ncbi:MAG TPA: Wzz/FepE/Etk N-terminal domain-containing protein, partial [Bryobacteraceae bacterium]|nr:Wzz/FepE/Etk N-terminal domain-containing protein [Bryobacteraceae bacterium]